MNYIAKDKSSELEGDIKTYLVCYLVLAFQVSAIRQETGIKGTKSKKEGI